jgi:UDP-N-acetyl-D-mannosaminuronate dehydrogenase
MKIGLFGLGYVGSAVFHTHRNQEVIVRDPKLDTRSSSLDEIYSCDAVYVCVPTKICFRRIKRLQESYYL